MVLDTNILTHLYIYPSKISNEIIGFFNTYEGKLWIPNQVYLEFLKNYNKCKGVQKKKYNNIKKSLSDELDKNKIKLNELTGEYQKNFFSDIINLHSELNNKIDEMKKSIDKYLIDHSEDQKSNEEFIESDKVLNFVQQLEKAGRVGSRIKFMDRIEILKEGDIRYKNQLPPGYRDINKEGQDKYGDLFIWKEMLNYSKKNKCDIIFITDDKKEDWWEKKVKN